MKNLFLEDEVLDLNIRMADSKKDLLEFINYFYGKRTEEYWDADFLIKLEEDLDKWIELYNGDPDEIEKVNTYLRRWKMDQHIDDGYADFIDLWELDKEDFVETYFGQHGMDRWILEIEEALENGLTMEILWERHLNNKYSRVEYLLYEEI